MDCSFLRLCVCQHDMGNTYRFEAHFVPNSVKLGTSERQIVLLGGKACIEEGPLAQFTGAPSQAIHLVSTAQVCSMKQILKQGRSNQRLRTGPACLQMCLMLAQGECCLHTCSDEARQGPLPSLIRHFCASYPSPRSSLSSHFWHMPSLATTYVA